MLAAVQILGGHWAVLQSVAWVGMVVKYAQHGSLESALEKTFDGTHPCQLCQVVLTGRNAEEKQPLAKDLLKLKFEAVLAPATLVPAPLSAPREFFLTVILPQEVPLDVCTPPPRRG